MSKRENLLKKVIATYKNAKDCVSCIGSPFDMTEYNLEAAEYTVNDDEIIVSKKVGEDQEAKIIYNCASGDYAEILTYKKESDLLESVDFVDVMQCYRIANPADQSKVIRRFEEVKDWIRKNFTQKKEVTKFEKAIAESIEVAKKINFKAPEDRPDLTFITQKSFDNIQEFENWYYNILTPEQRAVAYHYSTLKLPALIACAEMLFDANIDNQNSVVFQVVSKTLNAGK